MQETPKKSLFGQRTTTGTSKYFSHLAFICCILLLAQQGENLVYAQSAAFGETRVQGINEFNCSLTIDGIVGNNIVNLGGILYSNLQTLQGAAYADVASDVRIQGDVTPTVLASLPGMQLTLLPFTVSPGDGVKYMTFGAMNNTQTQACITTVGVTLDQSPPTTSHPQSPSSNSVYTDTNLVLTWEDAIDTGVGLDEYEIYISRDISFPPSETYTFTSYGTSATLIAPLYLRGQEYWRIGTTDLLGNTVLSNPWIFTYNSYTPTGGPGDTPPPNPNAICGNTLLELGELCDDGNITNGDGCSTQCTTEPTKYCGDGSINQSNEQCDDGNIANGDSCSAQCQTETAPACGDGSVNQSTEVCDDGNATNGDGCSVFCMYEPIIAPISTCGNSIVEVGERCDDGNTNNNDNCSTDCTPLYTMYCGNGIREGDEVCDDGNAINGDSCTAQCQRERGAFCGDGIINQPNENCDDGNRSEADPCGNSCQSGGPLTCGDGKIDASEQCDDGNKKNGDGCSQRCTNETTKYQNEDTFGKDIPDKKDDTTGGEGNGSSTDTTKNIGTTDSIKIGKKPSNPIKGDLITQKLQTVDEFNKTPRRSERQLFESQKFGTQSAGGGKNGPLNEHAAPFRSSGHPRGGLSGGKSFTKITGVSILIFFALTYDIDTYRVRYRMILFKEPVMVAVHLTYFRSRGKEV